MARNKAIGNCAGVSAQDNRKKDLQPDGKYPVFGANGVIGRYNEFNHENEEIAVTCRGNTCGTVNLTTPRSWITGNAMVIKPLNETQVSKKFLFNLLENFDFSGFITGSAQPQITRKSLSNLKFALPSLEEQVRIVHLLEGIDNAVTASFEEIAKLSNVRNTSINIFISTDNTEFDHVKLGKIARTNSGTSDFPDASRYVALEHIEGDTNRLIGEATGRDFSSASTHFEAGNILFSKLRPYLNKVWKATFEGYCSNEILVYSPTGGMISKDFLFQILRSQRAINYANQLSSGTRMPRVKKSHMDEFEIALPPMEEQKRIVAIMNDIDTQIESARASLESLKKLRTNTLNALVSGEHEIPESYDEFIDDES